jgi:hypothetical protein
MTKTTSPDTLTPVTTGCEYIIARACYAGPTEYCGDDTTDDPTTDFPMFCTTHQPYED